MAKKTGKGAAAAGSAKRGRLPVAPEKPRTAPPGRAGSIVALYTEFDGELDDLPDLAAQLVCINQAKAALDLEAVTYRHAIRDLMETVKSDASWSVRDEGTDWIATYIKPKPGKKLVPELLIKAGVTTKQLEKGYKEIPAKDPYVQVRTKGEKVGDENE